MGRELTRRQNSALMSYQKQGTLPPAAAAAIQEAIRLADDEPLAAIAAVKQYVEVCFIGIAVEEMTRRGFSVRAAAGVLNITTDKAQRALVQIKEKQR